MLVRQLPVGARVAEALHGEAAGWTRLEAMTADVFDVLALANWQRSGGGDRPTPYPRPKAPGAEAEAERTRALWAAHFEKTRPRPEPPMSEGEPGAY